MSKRYHILQARAQSVPVITTTSLTAGQMGQASSIQLQATSGLIPYNWAVTGGALPTGVSLNSTTGVISGTPTQSGSFPLQITLTDLNGLQASRNYVWAIANSAATVPGAPTIGTAVAGDKTATVSFTPPSNNGGAPITSYVVTSSPGNLSNTGSSSPIAVPNLIDGTAYTFVVRAINSVGQSPPSAASNSVTPTGTNTVPGAPTIGTATAGDATASVTFTAPTNNGGTPITGYKVISTPGGFIGTGTASPIAVNGLIDGTTYTFVVEAINAIGTSLPSAASNAVTPVNTPTTQAIRVSATAGPNGGGAFIGRTGAMRQFMGGNFEGLEDQAVAGNTPWGVFGIPPQAVYGTIGSWNQNIVRAQLAACSWLALDTQKINSTGDGWTGGVINCDTYGTYKAQVAVFIGECQRQGAVVMISNGGGFPKFTFNGVTAYANPDAEAPMACTDVDIPFWTSFSQTYGTQATPQTVTLGDGTQWTIDNSAILFDCYNEPNGNRYIALSTFEGLLKNGGTVATFSPNGGATVNQSWSAAGYQQHVAAIRPTGAKNPIGCAGPQWSANMTNFATWMPTDTLVPSQLFCTTHRYSNGTWPYTNGDTFLDCGLDSGGGTVNAINGVKAAMAAGYPVIIGETGGAWGTSVTPSNSEPAIQQTWNDAIAFGHSVVQWKIFPTGGTGAGSTAPGGGNLLATNTTPTNGMGVVWRNLNQARTNNL